VLVAGAHGLTGERLSELPGRQALGLLANDKVTPGVPFVSRCTASDAHENRPCNFRF